MEASTALMEAHGHPMTAKPRLTIQLKSQVTTRLVVRDAIMQVMLHSTGPTTLLCVAVTALRHILIPYGSRI